MHSLNNRLRFFSPDTLRPYASAETLKSVRQCVEHLPKVISIALSSQHYGFVWSPASNSINFYAQTAFESACVHFEKRAFTRRTGATWFYDFKHSDGQHYRCVLRSVLWNYPVGTTPTLPLDPISAVFNQPATMHFVQCSFLHFPVNCADCSEPIPWGSGTWCWCGSVIYCSVPCQWMDWETHRIACPRERDKSHR